MKKIICFLIMTINVFSITLQSSNGNITLSYDTENNVLKDLSLTLDEDRIDIERIEMGVWAGDKLYNIRDYAESISVVEGTNIIEIKGDIENSYEYTARIYSSIINKSRIVIDTEVKTLDSADEEIDFFYYVKPAEDYMDINLVDKYYSYGNIYMKSLEHKMKLYLTNDIYIEQLKFFPFTNGLKKRDDLALFFLSKVQGEGGIYKDTAVLSGEESDFIVDVIDYSEEMEFWKNFLKGITDPDIKKPLVELKSYQRRDGSFYNFYMKKGIIKVEDVIDACEAFLQYGYKDEGRRGIRYLLNSLGDGSFSIYGKHLISNYAYDFDRKEVLKRDNYGEMFNPINSSMFLKLYTDYYFMTDDKEFVEQNFELIEEKVAGYLLGLVDEQGVIPNSGHYRIGKEGMERFIETQKSIYDSFGDYIRLLDKQWIDSSVYEEAREKIKQSIVSYYIKDGRVLDYPFSKEAEWTNIYNVDLEFFEDEAEYSKFLQDNMNTPDKYKDRSPEEQVDYINFLFDKKYYRMAEEKRRSLAGRIKRGGINYISEMQKSIEFTAKYLIMLKKGDKDGDSI